MKKTFIITTILAIAVSIILFSTKECMAFGKIQKNKKENLVTNQIQEYPTPKEKNGKWGYANKEGVFVIAPKYFKAGNFSEGVAIVLVKKNFPSEKDIWITRVYQSGIWAAIDTKGNILFEKDTYFLGDFSEGVANLSIERDVWGKKGSLGNGVYKPGLWAIVDKNGNILFEKQAHFLGSFSEGLASVHPNNNGNKIGFINKKGEYVIEPIFHDYRTHDFYSSFLFENGLCVIGGPKKDTVGVINKKGKWIIERVYNEIYINKDDFKLYIDGKEGIMNKKRKIVIKPEYDYIYDTYLGGGSEPFFIVRMNGKYGALNIKGKWVIKPEEYKDRDLVIKKLKEIQNLQSRKDK